MAKKSTTKEFIEKAIKIHGNRYDYSKVEYVNSYTKVIIICSEHGEFLQRPNTHLTGSHCDRCARILISSKNPVNQSITTETFIEKSEQVHGNKYNYSKTIYTTAQDKVSILCPEHGEFEQVANSHLRGHGCKLCAIQNNPQNKPSTTEEFIKRAAQVHGNKYDYSNTIYKKAKNKLIIACSVHGEFSIKAHSHLEGVGCPSCANYGFNMAKSAILYYLKVTAESGQELYKIGVTNRTVQERFNLTDLLKIEIIKQKLYEIGSDAYNWEQKLLKMYKQYQYKGPDILYSGNTELFTEDVISLYYKENQL